MIDQERRLWIEDSVDNLLDGWQWPASSGIRQLKESIAYSFRKGGKRFRPALALLLAEAFAVNPKKVLPWALAVEMIHTYSLIHDDLPSMDNDDFRRGEPTNHKVFGESTALLAGDALLTQAFHHLAKAYVEEPRLGLRLIFLLSQAAGIEGMVGGQAMDLNSQSLEPQVQDLLLMHQLKTGALIRASVEGAACICGLPSEKIQLCREFGENLGLAFQLKDDLLDSVDKEEKGSFPGVVGRQATQSLLDQCTEKAKESLRLLQITEGPLRELVEFNAQRAQ